MKKTVIFDFDGTIADSFATVVAIMHELTNRTQLVTPEEIVRLRHMRLLDVAKAEKVPKWRLPFLLMRGRRMMARRLNEVNVFGGMADTIAALHQADHQLYVMSSNSANNIRKFLRQHELDQYFIKIYGGVGLLSKGRALQRFLKVERLNPAACLYVGDEPRDIMACKEVAIPCIAVSWGFNAPKLLHEHDPLAVVDTPEKLLATITKVETSL